MVAQSLTNDMPVNKNKTSKSVTLLGLAFISFIVLLAIYFYINSTKVFSFNGYSIKIPRTTYPVLLSSRWVEIYKSETSAKEALLCTEEDRGTIDNPCGYGSLVFMVLVDKSKNQYVGDDSYIDSLGRVWQIRRLLPWTGSSFNMQDYESQTEINNVVYTLNLAIPEYSLNKINEEYRNKFLDSFSVK